MIRVTATDLDRDPGDSSTCEVEDDYVLVAAGSAWQDSVQVYRKSDGTETHVITIKGIIRRVGERGPITPEDR